MISPAIALFFIPNNRQQRKTFFILLATITGSILVFGGAEDGVRHFAKVKELYVGLPFSEFLALAGKILTLQNAAPANDDIYIHIISYIAGGILNFPQFFWSIVSFVYSYFYISAAFKIYYWYRIKNKSIFFLYFFALFLAFKSFEGINTVRTWTGLWVLFYGIISYYQRPKFKYLLLILAPPLIHIGYLALAVPVWATMLINTQNVTVKISIIAIFFVSFFVTIEQLGILERASQTEVGASKVENYHVEEAGSRPLLKLDQLGNTNFYKAIHRSYLNYFFVLCIAVIMIGYGNYFSKFNAIESKLFSIGLASQAFSNVTSFLFAVSNRSAEIAVVFICASLVLYFQRTYFDNGHNELAFTQRKLVQLFSILLSTIFLYKIAAMIQWLNVFTFGLPFLAFLFEDLNITVRDFLAPIIKPLFS